MIRIKVCGITRLEDAIESARLGYDAVGFIFSESPRKIEPQKAKNIIDELPPFIVRVGVFVNETKEKVFEVAKFCKLDALQFHGDESPDYCQIFKEYRVIKALRINTEKDIEVIPKYNVDAVLLDTFSPNAYGGTGITFNWDIARKARNYQIPIVLSGGLNTENVKKAIEEVNPYALDVSSGVEDSPGVKNRELMAKFIALAYQEEWGM
jgi:phosphoribosylanthranilate isomerase